MTALEFGHSDPSPPPHPYRPASWQFGTAPKSVGTRVLGAGPLVVGAVLIAIVSAVVGGVTAVTLRSVDFGDIASVHHGRGGAVLGESVQRGAARALPSVVKLETTVGASSSEGSGIILRSDGLILTNNHVVAVPDELAGGPGKVTTLTTFVDGRTAPFVVLGGDPVSDIAVVRVPGISGLIPIAVGSSADLAVGQNVVAVGAPLGMDGTATFGIISALHRPVSSRGDTSGEDTAFDAIQTDAAINPGNSGGALVDTSGALIGINTSLATTGGDYVDGPGGSIGLGFAIPVDQAIRVVDQIVTTGNVTHATLGVRVVDDGTNRAAKVVEVAPGGPAAAAGLTPGDLITMVDARVVTNAAALIAALASKVPGDTLTLSYADPSGLIETVQVTLGSQ